MKSHRIFKVSILSVFIASWLLSACGTAAPVVPTVEPMAAAPVATVVVAPTQPPAPQEPGVDFPIDLDGRQDLMINGSFESGMLGWWTTSSVSTRIADGQLLGAVTQGGVQPWDAILGQHGIALLAGETYTLRFVASANQQVSVNVLLQLDGGDYTRYFDAIIPLSSEPQEFIFNFVPTVSDPQASFQFHLGSKGEFHFTLAQVSLLGPAEEQEEVVLSAVYLNQSGYLPLAQKRAAIAHESTQPLPWRVLDAGGAALLTGTTSVFGPDAASGDHIHIADFSELITQGSDYILEVNGTRSHPFAISPNLYGQIKYDALAYFYHNRSGIEITMPYAGEERWARPAGHVGVLPNRGDQAVPCFSGSDMKGRQWSGCDYTLDVSGGWYDAGDHGKYVVNGGISAWTLMNLYERWLMLGHRDAQFFRDGGLNIPENGNGIPDLLDEIRWQMEFMLSMQVPPNGVVEGLPVGGMAHHKIHSSRWTGMGTAPHKDNYPRYLYPPSTTATLNLAATAAQCARIWKDLDAEFSERCLNAATTAWNAALANPRLLASGDFDGGGPYDDTDLSDEFYWAAAEMYITTGMEEYQQAMAGSRHYLAVPGTVSANGIAAGSAMGWQQVAALGTISLAVVPSDLPVELVERARSSIIKIAGGYAEACDRQGYHLPFAANRYPWGSNSSVLNNQIILGLAYDFTGEVRYAQAVADGMDYLLGRNPLDQSYITGYGAKPLQNPHHRFWAYQKSPPGVVSGGPNSDLQDPYAQSKLTGCAPQKCFVDHLNSWSTNEVTINWNAPLVWVTAFLDGAVALHGE
jgi:endoglucanase